MASRAGWTFNGKHFTETFSLRMGRRIEAYRIDGKPVSRRDWLLAIAEAKAADAAKLSKAEG